MADNHALEAKRQKEQLEKYLEWIRNEGGVEGPTHLSTWFSAFQQKRLRWLRNKCKGSSSVIELGCNYAYVLAYCTSGIVCKRTGIDWNEQSILLAQVLNPGFHFYVHDIRKLPFRDKGFHTVLCTDVLEHFDWKGVESVIEEAKRITAHQLIVTVPNGNSHTELVTNLKHQTLFTSSKIRELELMLEPFKVQAHKDFYFGYMEATRTNVNI